MKLLQIFFCFGVSFVYSQDINLTKKKIEDFESTQFSIEDFKIYSNSKKDFQVWKSTTLTAPTSESKTTFLLKIKNSSSKIPIEFMFKAPYEFEEFLDSLEFTFYSSGSNSELYFYFDDTKFIRHKVLISKLQDEGWKTVRIPIQKIIWQRDYVAFKRSKTSLVGIVIETGNLSNFTELIIGFAHIDGYFKSKILLP